MAVVTYNATGRRKSSVARVRLVPGEGKIIINQRELDDYFGLKTLELIVNQQMLSAVASPARQAQSVTALPALF